MSASTPLESPDIHKIHSIKTFDLDNLITPEQKKEYENAKRERKQAERKAQEEAKAQQHADDLVHKKTEGLETSSDVIKKLNEEIADF